MVKLKALLAVSTLALTAACGVAENNGQQQSSSGTIAVAKSAETVALHKLFDEQWQTDLKENPFAASYEGVKGFDHILPSVTPDDHARRLKQDREYLDKLRKIDRSQLSAADQVNYDAFDFYMHHRIKRAEFKAWRIPLLSDSGFYDGMLHYSRIASFKTAEDAENYIARLKAVPAYFAQHTANMQMGIEDGFVMPKEIIGGIQKILNGMDWPTAEESPFFAPFGSMADTITASDQDRLKHAAKAAINDAVIPAYKDFTAFFSGPYQEAAALSIAASDLPNGDAYYDAQVKFFTTLDLSADEIHNIGLSEVKRIRAAMDKIIEEVSFEGSFADFLHFLRTDPQFYAKTPEELLKEAAYIAKEADGRLPAFFGRLPRQPYSVQPVPDDIAPNYTGGRYVPAPLDALKGGEYWVNTYALDKRPLYVLPALSLHEGVPGHHLQFALTAELENMPKFRSAMTSHAYQEGWGLYTEALGVEMGTYKTPYEHFGRLTYEMWRACRLVVDTGMHTKGWSREQAQDYLRNNSAMSLQEVLTEVDRYIAWPGQALAYKMGELKIWELRHKSKQELGDKFDVRDFHDALHANGSIPLQLLEQQINAYIQKTKGQKIKEEQS
ncbi:MAG: DUF885 family protein [Kordiimonas sp.]